MKVNKSFLTTFALLFICMVLATRPVLAQDATTGIQGGTLCPNSQFISPLLVTGLQDIDSISLTLHIPSQGLSFNSFRQVNPLLLTGFVTVTETVPGTVLLTWHTLAPISISEGKLLDLIFDTQSQPGNLTWDEPLCFYRQSGGAQLSSTFTGDYVDFYPRMTLTLEEIDKTCSGKCDANVAAFVRGGLKPYIYLWNGTATLFDSIKTQACGGYNNLNITDANSCVLDTNFVVSELPATKIELEMNPDTVYLQNPVVYFSFTEDPDIVEWIWDFGDGSPRSRDRAPSHLYAGAQKPDTDKYIVTLNATNSNGCDTLISVEIPVREVEVFIPNVFTPPTDPNGTFKIAKKNDGASSGSEYIPIVYEYQRMELFVFDRWGRKVYHNSNYKNNWDGDYLPDGTYYYKLNTFGFFHDDSYTGSVTIIREK